MNNKEFSPLLAVAIIIIFTITLAAIIFSWETLLGKGLQEDAEQLASEEIERCISSCPEGYERNATSRTIECMKNETYTNQDCLREFGKAYCESINKSFFYALQFNDIYYYGDGLEIKFNCKGAFNRLTGSILTSFYFSEEELILIKVISKIAF